MDNGFLLPIPPASSGLESMFHVSKFNHPNIAGGARWTDSELAWINERITLAILAEREACASVAEDTASGRDAEAISDAIRLRTEAGLGNKR